MSEPPETSELLAFVRTVDLGSLSAAAADLGQPRATVARRLERLEERVGARLLHRTTRRIALTEVGAASLEHARRAVDAAADVVRAAAGTQAIAGVLRVSIPPPVGGILSMLLSFRERYPEVVLEVMSPTDHTDLVAARYDVALRATARELPPGYVARVLVKSRLLAVACPGYLAARGAPDDVGALLSHACIVSLRSGQPVNHWPRLDGTTAAVRGAMATNELSLMRAWALGGLGIAMLPEQFVSRDLASGALVQVLVGVLGGESRIAVVYPEKTWLPAPVRAFVEHALAVAKAGQLFDSLGESADR